MKATTWQGKPAGWALGVMAWSLLAAGPMSLAACGSDNDDPPVAQTPAPSPAPAPSPTPAPAPAPAATDRIAFGGDIDQARTLTLADLQAQPPVTQTVEYTASGQPRTKTYTGALLWSLIDSAGVKVDATRNNDLLNFYVVARGADDYRGVFALGELSPNFGNRASVIAYAETVNGQSAALIEDGPLRVTSPGDVRGGRYVSELVAVDVLRSGSTVAAIDGQPSTSFAVSGAVTRPGTFDLAALSALPEVTATVGANSYRGVSLWTFLDSTVGVNVDPAAHNPTLSMYVVGTGSDGYKAVVSLGEINPGFGNQPALIAYEMNGEPFAANGFARLVLPNDVRAGRSVSRLIGLEVLTAAP